LVATVPAPELALPSPADNPGGDVVVYDGDCAICRAQVSKLPKLDGRNRLAYLSLHDAEVHRRWPDASHDRLMKEMLIVDRHGGRHWGPEAVRYLTRRLPRLWLAAPLAYFPGSMVLWRPLYRWVAHNRYRLSGKSCDDGACQLHR
jgi:predicted DCC family thiol-disulfide oxidoreductase YuxK